MNIPARVIVSKPGTLVLILLTASTLSLTAFGNTRVIDVLILGAAAGVVVFWMSGPSNYVRLPRPVIFPMAVIWALFLLSSITAASTVPESTLQAAAAIVISGTGVFIIPKVYAHRSFFRHVLSLSFLLGLLSILAVVMPIESVGPVELLRAVPYDRYLIFGPQEYAPVPVSGLKNPNILAITLLPGIIVGVNHIRKRAAGHSIRGVISFGLVTAVPTAALVLTRSRGAMLALAAAIVIYVVVHDFSSVIARVLCLCVIIGTVFFLALSGIGPNLIETVSAGRAFRWRYALDAIFQQPLLGYGVGNSRVIIPELQTQPHNAYFMLGAWSGVGAAILYLYLFAQILLLSVRKKVGTTPAVFPAILTSYWFISVFESVDIFHLTIYSIILAITFGFVASGVVPHKQAPQSKSAKKHHVLNSSNDHEDRD